MAVGSEAVLDATAVIDSIESDYGSDFDDDDFWDQAFSQSEVQPVATNKTPSTQTVVPRISVQDVEELAAQIIPEEDEAPPSSLRIARVRQHLVQAIVGLDDIARSITPQRARSVEIEYDEVNRHSFSPLPVEGLTRERSGSAEPQSPETVDNRTPIERFRTKPKKTLSVTDIVSPAWCELQYWYSLTKYGRIRRTPAMKQGSKIHKEKEREVHTEVPVEVATKEDQLGLRIWNIIQGLRTLQATGLTRELEVFGVVEGEVIIGIIDELSFTCPDEAMERSILQQDGGKGNAKAAPADQPTLAEYFGSSQGHRRAKPLYLLDIKTRQSRTLPKLGSPMRPTQMQLMLYRRLLNDLAANKVEAHVIFDRYNVDPYKPFSDTFIAALGGIDFQQITQDSPVDDENDDFLSSSQPREDPLDEILSHNTLSSLWSHMIAEFSRCIAVNALSSSISPLLTAEFRASSNGELIGRRSFAFDEAVLEKYVHYEMRWWRGEREACGVDIEEAYKCGICEFAEKCTWRKGKIEEATNKARLRNATRKKSTV